MLLLTPGTYVSTADVAGSLPKSYSRAQLKSSEARQGKAQDRPDSRVVVEEETPE